VTGRRTRCQLRIVLASKSPHSPCRVSGWTHRGRGGGRYMRHPRWRRPLSPARDEPLRGCLGFNHRMVILGFGPGHPEDLGEVAPCVCPNCHNQVFLHHVRSKKSVRLYFVPVVPYGTDDYLVCPVCSRGLQISSAQLPYLRSMSGATASFRAERLTQARYLGAGRAVLASAQGEPRRPAARDSSQPRCRRRPASHSRSVTPPLSRPRPWLWMTRRRGYRNCASWQSCTTRGCFRTLPLWQPSNASWNRRWSLSRRGRRHRRRLARQSADAS
jgi:hypothetical protein